MLASYLFPFLSLLFLGLPIQPATAAPTPRNLISRKTKAKNSTPLPEVSGATIDRSSLIVGNSSGVLVHYISNNVDFSTASQAIVVVHGVNRDANNSFASVQAAVNAANKSDVVIMAVRTLPHFPKMRFNQRT